MSHARARRKRESVAHSAPQVVESSRKPAHAAGVDIDRINYVNIGLMIGSAALACTLPLEIFLLSYAVLGPLHYLTQISWLHDRGFYTTGRHDWIPLALFGGIAFLSYTEWLEWDGVMPTALAAGVLAAFVSNLAVKVVALGVLAALGTTILTWEPAEIFFVVLLTTVVHVYVFTGLFILAGSMRGRSRSGYLSLAVYVACGIGLLVIQPGAASYNPSEYVRDSLGPFVGLMDAMMRFIPGDGEWNTIVAVGRFLAFAYTYHYLNWFSKTEIIRWHDISRARMAVIAAVWVASLALYGYDYGLGLTGLYFLSIVHVFLEFPLDARTLVEVAGGSLRLRAA